MRDKQFAGKQDGEITLQSACLTCRLFPGLFAALEPALVIVFMGIRVKSIKLQGLNNIDFFFYSNYLHEVDLTGNENTDQYIVLFAGLRTPCGFAWCCGARAFELHI